MRQLFTYFIMEIVQAFTKMKVVYRLSYDWLACGT